MQNQVQLFHPVHLDYCRQEFILNVKSLKEQLLDTLLTLFIYYQQLKSCPEKKTTKKYLIQANKFYKSISMNPIKVKNELPGYLSDRLQEALWREGLHIINEGHATTEDLDRAIEDGPGLRWSLMGTFLTFHLAGGKSGMKHMLEQFGPALKLPWTKLKAPKLSNRLINRLVQGTKKQSKGRSVSKISNIRDEYLVKLLQLRKKYEKKLR